MKRPWFPLYATDWLTDHRVRLLSVEARGLYIDLLCHQWAEGGLPDDERHLARIANLNPRTFRRIWTEIERFFSRNSAGIRLNHRLEKERKHADEKSEMSAKAANTRHHGDADALPSQSQSQHSHKHSLKNSSPASPGDAFDFDAVWAAYPRKLGRKKGLARCKSQVTTRSKYDALVKAVGNYRAFVDGKPAEYVKHFDTFMNCWEDWIDPPPPSTDGTSSGQRSFGYATPSTFTESCDAGDRLA
jgi:uncharacterized protein YdaU (DUF1376 family)